MLNQFKNNLLKNKEDKTNRFLLINNDNNDNKILKKIELTKNRLLEISSIIPKNNQFRYFKGLYKLCDYLFNEIQSINATEIEVNNLIELLKLFSKKQLENDCVLLKVCGNIILYSIISVFSNYYNENLSNNSFLYPFVQNYSKDKMIEYTEMIDNLDINLEYKMMLEFFYTLLLKKSNEMDVCDDFIYVNEKFNKLLKKKCYTFIHCTLQYCEFDKHNAALYSSLLIDGLGLYFYACDLNIPNYDEYVHPVDFLENVLVCFQGILSIYPYLSLYFWEDHPYSKALYAFYDLIISKPYKSDDLTYQSLLFLTSLSKSSPLNIHETLHNSKSIYSYHNLFGYLNVVYDSLKHPNQKEKEKPKRAEVLSGVLILLYELCKTQSIAELLISRTDFHLYDILLTFIYSDVDPIIKGSSYNVLAALTNCPQISAYLTDHLIAAPLVSNNSVTKSNLSLISSFQTTVANGIRYELDYIEQYNKSYTIIRGFLNLINNLIITNPDQNIIYKKEFEVYYEFIINDILSKIDSREYEIEDEKYDIYCNCLTILINIIDHYKPITIEEDIRIPFQLLTTLFRGGPLYQFITSLLKDTPSQLNDIHCSEESLWSLNSCTFNNKEKTVTQALNLLYKLTKIEDIFTQNIRQYFPTYITSPLYNLILSEPSVLNHILLTLSYSFSNMLNYYGIRLLNYVLSHTLPKELFNKIVLNGILNDLLDSYNYYFGQFLEDDETIICDNKDGKSIKSNSDCLLKILINHAKSSNTQFLLALFGITENIQVENRLRVLETFIRIIKSSHRINNPSLCENISHIFYIIMSQSNVTGDILQIFRQTGCFINNFDDILSESYRYDDIAKYYMAISWILQCIAIDLQISSLCNPPVYDNISILLNYLYISPNATSNSNNQTNENKFLQIFRNIIGDNYYPDTMPVKLQEIGNQYNIFYENQYEGVTYRLIDIKYVNKICNTDNNTKNMINLWCLSWNRYVEKESSKIQLLQSWFKVIGITLLSKINIFQIPASPIKDGNEIDLICQILNTILQPLHSNNNLIIKTKEILAGIVVLLLSQLNKRTKNKSIPQQSILKPILLSLKSDITSPYFRSLLYSSILEYLSWNKTYQSAIELNTRYELLINYLLEDILFADSEYKCTAVYTLQTILGYDEIGKYLLYLSHHNNFQVYFSYNIGIN